jgi:hypothetical protein
MSVSLPVKCEHWRDTGVVLGGTCLLGKFGGQPGYGVCDRCMGLPVRKPTPEERKIMMDLLSPADPERIKAHQKHLSTEGPKRWKRVHIRALDWNPSTGDWKAETVFVKHLANGMGCECSGHWIQVLRKIPLDLSSSEAYFRCSWLWHVEVSTSINQHAKVPTLEEAKAFWESVRSSSSPQTGATSTEPPQ